MNIGPPLSAASIPAASRPPTLSIRGLAFSYGRAAPVFDDVSLDIADREIVCLLGGSGCGKSTLLRTAAGLEAPTRGEIRFLGERLSRPHPRAALVFQQAGLLPWLNVARNVGFGLDFERQPHIDASQRAERIDEALAGVGLDGKGHLYPSQLSGGMAQRVALARALARPPQLLFADEPFSALDAITRTGMQALLVDLVHRWNTAALLVTHDIDEAILVADRILLMGTEDGGPGRILRQWTVGLERPRHRQVDTVGRLRLEILAALREPAGLVA
ncbi:MAG TPA: ABC transporter ATP-binding protein [Burkholderiaceae bacterium]|nr:ABC transporter ATP-binding protein [Burkholderiaceae bacterium]